MIGRLRDAWRWLRTHEVSPAADDAWQALAATALRATAGAWLLALVVPLEPSAAYVLTVPLATLWGHRQWRRLRAERQALEAVHGPLGYRPWL